MYHRVRLNRHWKERLQQQPRSGFGYQGATVTLRDGNSYRATVLGGEFVQSRPGQPGIDLAEVADIVLDAGDEGTGPA